MMDLDTMKSDWDKAGKCDKTRDELSAMIKENPYLKRAKIRFITEGLVLVVFTLFYYDGFDGDEKPVWLNVLLTGAAILYILNRYAGWYILRNPESQIPLKKSLAGFENRLKWIAFSTLVTSCLFGVALLLFFAWVIDFTTVKYLLLASMLLVLGIFTWWSWQVWLKRIKAVKALLEGFK